MSLSADQIRSLDAMYVILDMLIFWKNFVWLDGLPFPQDHLLCQGHWKIFIYTFYYFGCLSDGVIVLKDFELSADGWKKTEE